MVRHPLVRHPLAQRFLVFALSVASVAIPALAQDGGARRHGIFLETIDVNLINIEVSVKNANGDPVTDLTREDFTILDDGEPVEITNFYRVEGGVRRVPEDGVGPAYPGEAAAEGAAEPANLVILVDNTFISAESRNRIFKEIRESLDRLMADGTQVMVAVKDWDVEVEQPLTTDRTEVDATLARLAETAGLSSGMSGEIRSLLRQIEAGSEPMGGGGVGGADVDLAEADAEMIFGSIRLFAAETVQNVERSVQALSSFLGSIAVLPGKKALLYGCDQLPIHPAEHVINVWFAKYGQYGPELGVQSPRDMARDFDTTLDLDELVAEASANRVAVYPVGLGTTATRKAISASGGGMSSSPGAAPATLTSEEAGLRALAHGTGGHSALGQTQLEPLFDRLRQDLTHYYSLGYPAPHGGDGEAHRIRVKVDRPNVQVDYLRTYRDKDRDQQMADRTLASLFHSDAENPLNVRVRVGEMEPKMKGRKKTKEFLVPIEVRLPMANLVLLPEEAAHVGKLSIFLVVRDAEGRLSPPTKIELPIEIPNDDMLTAMTGTAGYRTKLAMRPGEQTIAIGVRDDVGQASSTLNVEVEVGG